MAQMPQDEVRLTHAASVCFEWGGDKSAC